MRNVCPDCRQGVCQWWCQWCLVHHPVASMVKDCLRKFKPSDT